MKLYLGSFQSSLNLRWFSCDITAISCYMFLWSVYLQLWCNCLEICWEADGQQKIVSCFIFMAADLRGLWTISNTTFWRMRKEQLLFVRFVAILSKAWRKSFGFSMLHESIECSCISVESDSSKTHKRISRKRKEFDSGEKHTNND